MVEQVKTKTEPHVRFRGFTDEWNEVKLGDVAKVVMGQSPKSENYTDDNSFPILVQGNADIDNGAVNPRVWTKQVTKLVKADTILLSVRAPVGDVALSQYDVVIGRGMAGIAGNSFIYQKLIHMNDTSSWRRYTTGSTFKSINSKDVKNALILTPSLDEQQKIGELFQTLDKTIDLSNTQVESLKQQRKALLQRLFPQKGETEPTVRVRGFTDAWEEVTLGDVANINKGKQLSKNDVVDEGLYYHINGGQEPSNRTNLWNTDANTISISEGGNSCGYVNWNSEQFYSGGHNYTLELKDTDGLFLYSYLKANEKALMRLRVGTGLPNIQKGDITKFKVHTPSLEEQQKIGELFQTVDEQISQAEDKVSQYKELKRALLQRLFV